MSLLGVGCKCINHLAKFDIETALGEVLIDIGRELKDAEILFGKARQDFIEITGSEPGEYKIERRIQHLKKRHKLYVDLRDEILSLPQCDEPAFEVKS